MEQRVLTRLRKHFQVGSEDWNDVAFTGQRIRWTQDFQNGPYIEVSQDKAIVELEEIPVERNTKEDLQCTPAMHTMCRSLLGQINWLQSRTRFQCCYKSPRCSSDGSFPNSWPYERSQQTGEANQAAVCGTSVCTTGPLRILGCPDASYRNNDDGSSQRGMTVFLAASRDLQGMK